MKRRAYEALFCLAVYAAALSAARCTPSEQAQAAKDAREALDKACAARQIDKAVQAAIDGGAQ